MIKILQVDLEHFSSLGDGRIRLSTLHRYSSASVAFAVGDNGMASLASRGARPLLFAASGSAEGLQGTDTAQISVCLTSRHTKYGWKRIIIRLNSSELAFCVSCHVHTSSRRKSQAITFQGFISPPLPFLALHSEGN